MDTVKSVDPPFQFFDLHVVRVQRLSLTMTRITFSGPALDTFANGGRDQRFKIFLPHPHQTRPVVPVDAGTNWFKEWQAMHHDRRAIMRSYTIRQQRHAPEEIDVDFVLHGDAGPASRWASRANLGDEAIALGPVIAENKGVDFCPPSHTKWVLIGADETALPAAAGILEWLPSDTRAHVWIEVPHSQDIQHITTNANVDITWLVRNNYAHHQRSQLFDAISKAEFPEETPYAWIAGESTTVKSLRRHLVNERGFDRSLVSFTGYWRKGAAEETLLAEAISNAG